MTRNIWLLLAVGCMACDPTPSQKPQTGSQTNWLTACSSTDDCGGLECLCGTCTVACSSDDACAGLTGASCAPPSDEASLELCGTEPAEGLCLPDAPPAVQISIDTSERHQPLVGFGASLAYADDAIVARSDKAELYDLVFSEANLTVLRVRNRFTDGARALGPAREIVAAAEERIGSAPVVFMTSGSPPAELKANASRVCAGDAETCTLRTLPSGDFDYEGFASYWRASLDAYAEAGLAPDYVSIQNNPNWLPTLGMPGEGCRFLPEEGTESIEIDGAATDVRYPGYREALAAVRASVADMQVTPRLAAPESTGPRVLGDYARAAGAPSFEAIALHLYGQNPASVDVATLESVASLASELDRPVFQTEMQAGGLETAIFAHHALTKADAAVYLQNDLVALSPERASTALVLLAEGSLEPQGPYYALMHFAKHTAPGFRRVGARSEASELLVSAWLAPDDSALTIVLVNPSTQAHDAQLTFDTLGAELARTELARTTFDGSERHAALSALSPDGLVTVPAHAIVTIARKR
jgi:glucuronoarabinoxylan endo-1,4-beta-xylanase